MAMTVPAKIGRCALLLSPIVIVPAAVFAAIPWLKGQNDGVVLGFAAVAAIFVMGYAVFLSARWDRRLDEVQRAGQRFAQTNGAIGGSIATVLLMMLPPVMSPLVDFANRLSTGSPDVTDRGAVHLAIVFGFMLLMLMQGLGALVAGEIWKRRVGYR